mgnify:CR=1 FL=1
MKSYNKSYSLYEIVFDSLKDLSFMTITTTIRSLYPYTKKRKLNVFFFEDPTLALSTCLGTSLTGCRSAFITSSIDLYKIIPLLREISLSGIRGSLLLIVTTTRGFDPRLVSDVAFIPLLEPLDPLNIPHILETASELSEAIEVPLIIDLPEFDFKVSPMEVSVSSVSIEPIFSRHWEYPYRWIHESFTRNKERTALLSKIYERLFSEFEFNSIPDTFREKMILCFGWSYLYAKSYLESLRMKVDTSNMSLLGISIYVPLYVLSEPPSWFMRVLKNDVKEMLIIESGESILENYFSSLARGDLRIYGKKDLKRYLPLHLLVRDLVSDFIKHKDAVTEYMAQVEGIVFPRLPSLEGALSHIVNIVTKVLNLIKGFVIVTTTSDVKLRNLLNEVMLSKAKADYDIKSRKYRVKLPVDVIDVAYASHNPISTTLGERLSGIKANLIVISSVIALIKCLDILSKLSRTVVLLLDENLPLSKRYILNYIEKKYRLLRIPVWEEERVVFMIREYFSSKEESPLIIFLLHEYY